MSQHQPLSLSRQPFANLSFNLVLALTKLKRTSIPKAYTSTRSSITVALRVSQGWRGTSHCRSACQILVREPITKQLNLVGELDRNNTICKARCDEVLFRDGMVSTIILCYPSEDLQWIGVFHLPIHGYGDRLKR